MTQLLEKTATRLMLGLSACLLMSSGCGESEAEHDHIVYHHKPASFPEAIDRLFEIHATLVGEGPLPADREFIIHDHDHHHHGHDHDHDHDDDHDHVIVRVSLFEEWHDVVRWLPAIAADSDLPKTVWDAIRARCRELEPLEGALKATEPERRREEYRQHAREFEVVLKSLRDRVDEYEHWDEVFPD